MAEFVPSDMKCKVHLGSYKSMEMLSEERTCRKCLGKDFRMQYQRLFMDYPEGLLVICNQCGFLHGMYHTADYEEKKW